MENLTFEDVFPIGKGGFPLPMLVYWRVETSKDGACKLEETPSRKGEGVIWVCIVCRMHEWLSDQESC